MHAINEIDETAFYHAIAIAAHGDYHAIKKYRATVGDRATVGWEAVFRALKKGGGLFPDPQRQFARLEALGIRLILTTHRDFPEGLRHIPHSPFGIYVRGELPCVAATPRVAPTIAVVGTRRASAEGKRTAHDFSRALARAGLTIASGLAFGIDAAAHEGCLDGDGATIAVLAGGLDAVSPHTHRALAEKILARGGALISEYPPGEEPFDYRFIERNRIMSGLARGVLVVEAPESSGALATARYAVEQNRDLFVVPGSVTDGHFKGSHTLIRQGAELVTSPDDILDAYNITRVEPSAARGRSASPEEILVLRALEEAAMPADVDKLAGMTRLEPRIINRTLTFLIMEGIVKEGEDGYTI